MLIRSSYAQNQKFWTATQKTHISYRYYILRFSSDREKYSALYNLRIRSLRFIATTPIIPINPISYARHFDQTIHFSNEQYFKVDYFFIVNKWYIVKSLENLACFWLIPLCIIFFVIYIASYKMRGFKPAYHTHQNRGENKSLRHFFSPHSHK